MIRLEKIEIFEFRGIRKFSLDLKKKNFGIVGPNGTGKSGIVDAIEFALTGNITRLGGAGTAEVSVKAHAPHVDASKTPEKAIVRVTAYAPSLKKTIVIERSVKAPSAPIIFPNDASTKALVEKLETHPEFALSRREIIKYILTPAGERSKDVQILLRLDQVEKLRVSLQRVANDAKKDAVRSASDESRAQQDFLTHLAISSLSKSGLLAAVNARRTLLKLQPLAEINQQTVLKEGVSVAAVDSKKIRLSKLAALSDLEAFDKSTTFLRNEAIQASAANTLALIRTLVESPELLKGFRQKVLIEQGISLVEEDGCPLCDTIWDINELRAHLDEKQKAASAASDLLAQIAEARAPLVSALDDLATNTRKLVTIAAATEPPIDSSPLQTFAESSKGSASLLRDLDNDPSKLIDVIALLPHASDGLPQNFPMALAKVTAYVQALPDPSKEEEAKEFLIVAQEKYDRCRDARAAAVKATEREALSQAVFEKYATVSTAVLDGIYEAVQREFTAHYSFINRDDEEKFEGELKASIGKLAFDVDFYGRGKFPPGAYHSEGHQDGMGLCLYLALMSHTLGDDFTLAVLDDVLMSVDSTHRREVCALLKTKFPNTQFILTTHDPVWLQFMKSENLIAGNLIFGGWTVDTGPQIWNEGDVWSQIDEKLKKQDVSGAAATLRRYLEYIATILASNFRARIEYHSNGQYDLGDLWSPMIQAWKDRLDEAKKANASWGIPVNTVEEKRTLAKSLIAATNSEQWMINKAVHYNQWANLQATEFATLALAYQSLLQSMRCSNAPCGEFFAVTPPKGDRGALRCGCGNLNMNLVCK